MTSNSANEKSLIEITQKDGRFWIEEHKQKANEAHEADVKGGDDDIWVVANSLRSKNSMKVFSQNETYFFNFFVFLRDIRCKKMTLLN